MFLPRQSSSSVESPSGAVEIGEETVTTSFAHDLASEYLVTTSVTTSAGVSAFRVTAERASDSRAWAASFDARAVEALASASGAGRPFGAFVRLVRAALSNSKEASKKGVNGGASADLLSAEDVASSSGSSRPRHHRSPSSDRNSDNDKRYLVVSLDTQFDSAVYPLPLLPEPDAASAARLRALVSGLRSRVAETAAASRDLPAELARLRAEVDALRQALDESEVAASEQRSRAEAAERELSAERAARRRALRAAASDLESSKSREKEAREEVHAARLRCRALAGEVDELRRRLLAKKGDGVGGGTENVSPVLRSRQQKQHFASPPLPAAAPSPSTPSSTSSLSSPSPLARARAVAAAAGASEASRAPPLYSPPHDARTTGVSTDKQSELGELSSPGAEVEARLGALRAFIEGARRR